MCFSKTTENELNFNCRNAGILGSVTSFIASIQVTEAIREILRLTNIILGKKQLLSSKV